MNLMRKCNFKENDVISVNGNPALVTEIKHESIVYFCYIKGDGTLDHGDWFHDSDNITKFIVKHIDFAKVKTVVDLPDNWKDAAIEYDNQKLKEHKKHVDSMQDGKEAESHPSYGVIRCTHTSGFTPLFASPFRHQHFMSLEIQRAEMYRSLSNDRVSGRGIPLIKIYMSEAQWARFISSPNQGEGTPCTLAYVGGRQMEECPQQQDVEKFHDDVKRRLKIAAEGMEEAYKAAKVLVDSKTASKTERKAVLDKIYQAYRQFEDGLPFIIKQMDEHMDQVVLDAKTEIESFYNHQIQKLGLDSLKETKLLMLGKSKE